MLEQLLTGFRNCRARPRFSLTESLIDSTAFLLTAPEMTALVGERYWVDGKTANLHCRVGALSNDFSWLIRVTAENNRAEGCETGEGSTAADLGLVLSLRAAAKLTPARSSKFVKDSHG